MNIKEFFNYLKNLLPYVLSVYFLIVGISWIFFHAYLRFFIQRPSYMLEDLKPFITKKLLIFFVIFIVWHFIVVTINVFIVYKQTFNYKENLFFSNIVQKFSSVVNLIYWKPLDYIHNLIIPHIPMSGRFFIYVEKVWSKKANVYFYVLIFLFEILPKILIALVFLIEVIVFGQIKLFLHIISLIFITIAWNVFLKAFAYCGTLNLPIIKIYFSTIRGVGNPTFDADGNISSYSAYEFIVKPEYEDVINVEEEAKLLMQFESMPSFVEQIKKDTAKITPYITIITSLIYLIGGVYRLIFFLV